MLPRPINTAPGRQRGVVLVVALVLLVAITLLSLAGMSTTTLELLMATNQQARTNAFQQAEAGIDAVSSDLDNFAVSGLVGAERCTSGFDDTNTDVTCGSPDLDIPAEYDLTHSRAAVRRLPPLLQAPPRFIETSTEKLKVATFKIDSRYDARETRGGRAEHNQGVLITVLTPTEETVVRDGDFDTD